ncbi:tRNA preQ1(34) S-adenosylmethionine ribosyltransferase-isomerase QueA [Planctomycetota bacterium]
MKTEALNYHLPPELVAQHPVADRSSSRLLVVDTTNSNFHDHIFKDVGIFLRPGDLLVLNNTKVLPARFFAKRLSGGQLEGLFLNAQQETLWEVLLKGARKLKDNETFLILPCSGESPVEARLKKRLDNGHCLIAIPGCTDITSMLDNIGYAPLPPYIKRDADPDQGARDKEDYQTMYAQTRGAVAAPTAGLHFTDSLLQQLQSQGIELARLTLHVGIGTFKPVTAEHLENHAIHSESIAINADCATQVNRAKQEGRRVIAVGTTSTRALESAAVAPGQIETKNGQTQLFITPGYEYKIIDGLITNFHLPKSTLLALVGALAGMDHIMAAYRHAVKERYRFYSYGDAMLIL